MFILKLARGADGATSTEYALIATLISIVAIGAFQFVGGSVAQTFQTVSTALAAAPI